MVKKFLLSILTFLYLLLSTGFSLEVHYCMGSIAGIDITSSEDATCAKCGMKEKNTGCCRDEIKFYKFEKGFSGSKIIGCQQTAFSDIIPTVIPYAYIPAVVVYNNPEVELSAPAIGGPPIYLLNRVFRI